MQSRTYRRLSWILGLLSLLIFLTGLALIYIFVIRPQQAVGTGDSPAGTEARKLPGHNVQLHVKLEINEAWDEDASPILLHVRGQAAEAESEVERYVLLRRESAQTQPLKLEQLPAGRYQLKATSPVTATGQIYKTPTEQSFQISEGGKLELDAGSEALKLSFEPKKEPATPEEIEAIQKDFQDAQQKLGKEVEKQLESLDEALGDLAQALKDYQKREAELKKVQEEAKKDYKQVFYGELWSFETAKEYADWLIQRADAVLAGDVAVAPGEDPEAYAENLAGVARNLVRRVREGSTYEAELYNDRPRAYYELIFDQIIKLKTYQYDQDSASERDCSRLDLQALGKGRNLGLSYKGQLLASLKDYEGKLAIIGVSKKLLFPPGDIGIALNSAWARDAELLWAGEPLAQPRLNWKQKAAKTTVDTEQGSGKTQVKLDYPLNLSFAIGTGSSYHQALHLEDEHHLTFSLYEKDGTASTEEHPNGTMSVMEDRFTYELKELSSGVYQLTLKKRIGQLEEKEEIKDQMLVNQKSGFWDKYIGRPLMLYGPGRLPAEARPEYVYLNEERLAKGYSLVLEKRKCIFVESLQKD